MTNYSFSFSLFTECVDSFVSLHFCRFLQQDYPLQASSLPSFLPSHKPLKATGRRPLCTGEALCRRECDSPTHGTQGSISKGKFTMHGCEELFKKQSKAGFAADKRNITQNTPHHCDAEKNAACHFRQELASSDHWPSVRCWIRTRVLPKKCHMPANKTFVSTI